MTLLSVTCLLFAVFLTHYCISNWITELPPSRWLAASAAMFIMAMIITVVVIVASKDFLEWWPIDGEILGTLVMLWFPLTLVVGVAVEWFFPALR